MSTKYPIPPVLVSDCFLLVAWDLYMLLNSFFLCLGLWFTITRSIGVKTCHSSFLSFYNFSHVIDKWIDDNTHLLGYKLCGIFILYQWSLDFLLSSNLLGAVRRPRSTCGFSSPWILRWYHKLFSHALEDWSCPGVIKFIAIMWSYNFVEFLLILKCLVRIGSSGRNHL